jgi:hypothetical protein
MSLQAWPELQRVALDDAHASWLPGAPRAALPDLLAQARRSPLGRRWIAQQLVRAAPQLLGRPAPAAPIDEAQLAAADWLLRPLNAAVLPLSELLLELGAMALAAELRAVVARRGFACLRAVLGEARHERALREGPQAAAAVVRPAEFNRALDSQLRLRSLVRNQGIAELEACAATVHVAACERVRLACERDWTAVQCSARLEPSYTAALVRAQLTQPEDAGAAHAA